LPEISDYVKSVDTMFAVLFIASLVILSLITFLMVYFVIRYRRKKHPRPRNIEGHLGLEIAWTVIPTILVVAIFYFGWEGFRLMRTVPENAMEVKVTARMWSWLFEYSDGRLSEKLYVPVGKPVKLLLSSQDVIHSLFIPAFRIKEDAVPGLTSYMWFHPSTIGTYDIMCAEYCGERHSYMLSKLVVLSEEDFLKGEWAEEFEEPAAEEGEAEGAAEEGEAEGASEEGEAEGASEEREALPKSRAGRILRIRGCLACHTLDGGRLIGPSLKGLFGKSQAVVTSGEEREVTVDEAYLRKAILEPSADMVKGFKPLMPSQQGVLSDEELDEIIEYIKQLQ
jgi:cytochrome c oxidase subunit 2